jgi:hypothetical protein
MSDKIELKEKLSAVDQNVRELWDAMDDEQRKALKSEFFILNRYISNVAGQKREIQEHFVLTVNEYFNKHWNTLQKNHPKLLWQLLCMCSYNGETVFFHQWMGFKKKKGDNKRSKFLLEIYPTKKQDEVEMMAELMDLKELKALAKDHGYDDKQIDKMFK